MQTERSVGLFGFAPRDHLECRGAASGRHRSGDRLVERFAACRRAVAGGDRASRSQAGEAVGILAGDEELLNQDELRREPVMAVSANKLQAGRPDCAPVAGKSTLNQLGADPDGADALSQDQLRAGLFLKAALAARTALGSRTRRRLAARQEREIILSCMTATAICRSISSPADICWERSCVRPSAGPEESGAGYDLDPPAAPGCEHPNSGSVCDGLMACFRGQRRRLSV